MHIVILVHIMASYKSIMEHCLRRKRPIIDVFALSLFLFLAVKRGESNFLSSNTILSVGNILIVNSNVHRISRCPLPIFQVRELADNR